VRTDSESRKHQDLVKELADKFEDIYDYRLDAVDGVTDNDPETVENDGSVGDGENKVPDIDAYDESEERMIRGEAKTGDGDIDSKHSITQYKLFSSRSKNGVRSWLYIIVPKSEKQFLEGVLDDNITNERFRNNIAVVTSDEY